MCIRGKAIHMLVPGVLHQRVWFCMCHRSSLISKVLSHMFMYLLSKNYPKLILLKCYSDHTQILQATNLSSFTATPEAKVLCELQLHHPHNYYASSFISPAPSRIPHPPSLFSWDGGVNYIIFLCSINYVNFCGNNIKYGNFASLFLKPLHSLTSVTLNFERKQLHRLLGNAIMLICRC